jgi:Rrf2 family protein
MITGTTELAIRWLVYLALADKDRPISPRRGAEALGCSPSYLAKTSNLLVKAGILASVRGVRGGVVFGKPPPEISLLEIVEACEGLLTAAYCRDSDRDADLCSFHRAMAELHETTTEILERWTIQDLLKKPARCPEDGQSDCKMFFLDCAQPANSGA